MIKFLINYVFSLWNYFFPIEKENRITNLYIVDKQGERKQLIVDDFFMENEHFEIEFIFNNKTYVHVVPYIHRDFKPSKILSAVINKSIDITKHVNKYLINDLKYIKVKHVIPKKYIDIFDTLEIIDNDCNSLVYRKLNSRLEFLELNGRIRRHSCDIH